MKYNNFDMLPEHAFRKQPFGKSPATLEGGNKGGGIEKPRYNPPAAAPAVEAAATTVASETPEDEDAKKKVALKLGAKSLEIPLTSGVTPTGTVGTGTKVG